MNYSQIKFNDIANLQGISVSLYVSGCPHKCKGCFNPETWEFKTGQSFTVETANKIIEKMDENGIERALNILGGEPLCESNLGMVLLFLSFVRTKLPNRPIWIWTGYTKEELDKRNITPILIELNITGFVDGKFVQSLKSYDLAMRGSSNQRIWVLENKNYIDKTKEF